MVDVDALALLVCISDGVHVLTRFGVDTVEAW